MLPTISALHIHVCFICCICMSYICYMYTLYVVCMSLIILYVCLIYILCACLNMFNHFVEIWKYSRCDMFEVHFMIGGRRGKPRLHERATVKETEGVCLHRPCDAPDMHLLQAAGAQHTCIVNPCCMIHQHTGLELHVSPEGEMGGVIRNVLHTIIGWRNLWMIEPAVWH